MKAFILAAGFGTRLFPLTIDRTKPAIPFLGKPLVGYVAEYLAGFGISDVVVNLHHQPQSVIEALGDGSRYGVSIEYAIEQPNILGTAGALDNARDLLSDGSFVIVNGKIITDIDIRDAIETHRRTGAIATMVLKPNEKRERFTEIHSAGGCVTGFGGFPKEDEESSEAPLMFTGIHILEPRALDYIPRGIFSEIVPAFYGPAIAAGETISAHITGGTWYELSTIRRYLDTSLELMNGDVLTGSNCRISDTATVRSSVIWDNVNICGGAELVRTVVADGVSIAQDEHFENVAIVRADMVRSCDQVPEKAPMGYFEGDKYIVPLD